MSEEKKKNNTGNKVIDIRKSDKIRPITFRPEEIEDPLMDEMILESLKEEADLLEEELNNDPELMGVGASDDLFLSIVNKLKEQGVWEEEEEPMPEEASESMDDEEETVKTVDNIPENEESCAKQEDIYRMLPEEDLQALILGREVAKKKEEKKIRRRKQQRWIRRMASVAAVFVLVFAVGMTSDANRRLVLKAWDAVMTVAGFKIETNYSENEHTIREEDEEEKLAWKDVAERLGISPLSLSYLPEGMEYERYEIFEESKLAMFMYSYNKRIINVNIKANDATSSMYYVNNEEAMLVDCFSIDKNNNVNIWRDNTGIDQEMYLAEFEHNGCKYIINGMISLEEIKKIIKNMIFL